MYAGLLALVPLMLERGLAPQSAAWVLGLGGVGQITGRLAYAALASRVSLVGRTVIAFGVAALSLLTLGLVPGPSWLLVVASMTAGAGRGIATLLQATAVTDRWGPRAYGRLSGVLGLPVLLAGALAPWAGALLAQTVGSYAAAFVLLAALAAAGAALVVASSRGAAAVTPGPAASAGSRPAPRRGA
jgi:MFS family permease